MITRKNWPDDWQEVPEWTEVDGEIYNHFLNCMPPMRWNHETGYLQIGEPHDHVKMFGRYVPRFLTFGKANGKCYFLGIQIVGEIPAKPRYTVHYIDGHDLKYKTFTTDAITPEEAESKMRWSYEADFDHQIIEIIKHGGLKNDHH